MRRLSAFLVAGFLYVGCNSAPVDEPTPGRVLVIGWDGATFDMIDPLCDAGRLPAVRALLDRGSSAVLESTRIPISSAAWAAIVTGKYPGKTGVYSFLEPIPGTYDARIISSRSNRATPLWRIASRHGLGVHAFGVPVTYPPEPVRGRMVAGMLSPFDAAYAYPPEYTDELRDTGFIPDLGIWRQKSVSDSTEVARQLTLKADAVLDLLTRDDWALAVVVFKSLDVVCHRDYDGDPEGSVADLYVRLDEILGRLLAVAGPETNVILLSDHGFRRYEHAFNLHEWLVQEGYAVRKPDVDRSGRGRGPLAERRAEAHGERLGALDMGRTRAFAIACEGNFGAIRLNLVGREPSGIVDPEDADALMSEIASRLTAMRAADSDIPAEADRVLFPQTFRGAELYPGPHQSVVPDLVVESEPRLRMVARAKRLVFSSYARGFPDHTLHGILVAAGPGIVADAVRGQATVTDIAPTVLHLLGLPVYQEMDGRSLAALLRGVADAKVIPEAEDPTSELTEYGVPFEMNDDERLELEERLRALGYAN